MARTEDAQGLPESQSGTSVRGGVMDDTERHLATILYGNFFFEANPKRVFFI